MGFESAKAAYDKSVELSARFKGWTVDGVPIARVEVMTDRKSGQWKCAFYGKQQFLGAYLESQIGTAIVPVVDGVTGS